MPTQTFQYFVPVGSTSVSITAAFFGAGGVTLDSAVITQSTNHTSLILTDPFNGTDKIITDAGFVVGNNVSFLNLGGTGSSAAGNLEYYDHGTSSWKIIDNVTYSGNQFTANDVPFTASPVSDWTAQDGGTGAWWDVQVRLRNAPWITSKSTNRFRPGIVFASLSQSEREHLWYRESMPGTAKVLEDNHMQVLWYNQSNKAGISWASMPTQLERKFITQTNYETNSSSDPSRTPIVAAANLFKRIIPDYPVMMVDHQWAGTSRTDMGYDGSVKRDWRQVVYTTEWLRQRNSYIGLQDECWYNSDANKSNNLFSRVAPFYMGVYVDQSKYTLGSGSTATESGGETWDHCFFDLSTAGTTTGRGIYRPDRTRISIMGPIPSNRAVNGFSGENVWTGISGDVFRVNSETLILNNFLLGYTGPTGNYSDTYSSITNPDYISTNYRRCNQSLGFVLDDSTSTNPWKEITQAWTWDTMLNLYGDWQNNPNLYGDLSHPAKGGNVANSPYRLDVNAIHGNILTGQYMAMSVAKAATISSGITANVELPVPILSLTDVSADGTRFTFRATELNGATLPAGYDLTTYRQGGATGIERGSARDIASGVTLGTESLAGLQPIQRQKPEVVGFEILRGISGSTENLIVDVRGTITPAEPQWQNYMGISAGYSVTFDADHCTVTYNVALDDGDSIRYGWGSLMNVSEQYDIQDKVHMDLLVVAVPGLSLPSQTGTNTGVTLINQPFDSVAGLPVCKYPRSPVWSVTKGAAGNKLNAHSFININSKTNTLIEGTSGPSVWALYDIDSEPPQGNTADNPQLNYYYPARFITPIVNEFTGHSEVRVLTHPYGGWATGGNNPNGVAKVEFFLNGGPAVLGTKTRDIKTNQQNIWSVLLPQGLSADIAEIRAKVYPKIGKVNVLQGTGYKSSQEAIALYGDRRQDDSPFTLVPYPDGIYPNRRGCIVQKGLTTYYVGPSGSDSNNGLSLSTAKLTPQAVYSAAGGSNKVKILNYYDRTNALHASVFVKKEAGYTHTDHLPIVEGGAIIWNSPSTHGGSNNIGVIFNNVDFRPDTGTGSNSLQLPSVGAARYVFIDCDMGPEGKLDSHGGQFGEIEEQASVGTIAGLKMQVVQTAMGNPTFFYNCDFRYSTISSSREAIDSVFVLPPAQNDVCNAQLLYNVKIMDAATLNYPYGSVGRGKFTFCPKGSAKTYVALGSRAGVTHTSEGVRSLMDDFYYTLGTSAGVSGSPNTGVTLTGAERAGKAEWQVIDPGATMKAAYEEIPNLGFYPDWIFSLAKVDSPWLRRSINVSYFTGATSESNHNQYAGGTSQRGWSGTKYALDPHLDITQTFWESDWNGVATDGNVYNTLVCDLYVTGHLNEYQGIFFSDNSRADGSAFWNTNLEKIADVTSAQFTLSGGRDPSIGVSADSKNQLSQYVHLGPYLQNNLGVFKGRFGAGVAGPKTPFPQYNLFFYETDGWKFPTDAGGLPSLVTGWDASPSTYSTSVGASGSVSSYQITDNPQINSRYYINFLNQVGGTLEDGTYVTPGLSADSRAIGWFGANFRNAATATWDGTLLTGQARFGITGQNNGGVITDPITGVTFQVWDGNGWPDDIEMKATTKWASDNGWRLGVGITFNTGHTSLENYWDIILAPYANPGITFPSPLNIQDGYATITNANIRDLIRDQGDSLFPGGYVDTDSGISTTTFTYDMVPMQVSYYLEKIIIP